MWGCARYEINWKQFRSTNKYTHVQQKNPMHENKPQIFIYFSCDSSLALFTVRFYRTEIKRKWDAGFGCCCCRFFSFFGIVGNLFGVLVAAWLVLAFVFQVPPASTFKWHKTKFIYSFLYQFITNDFCFVWLLLVNPQRTYFISFHFSFVIKPTQNTFEHFGKKL